MAEKGIPFVDFLLKPIIGTRNQRFVRRYMARVAAINALEDRVRRMTDAEIRAMLGEFRQRLARGETADDLLVEVFAVAREAMDRAVGIRNIFDPKYRFDASPLPPAVRDLYEKTRAQMNALPPILPRTLVQEPGKPPPQGIPDEKDEYLGCTFPVPGWLQADIPNEIYDAVRQLHPESRPPFRARPFDVQLIGGMVLYQGKIAEMKTGEGKTIVAPLACYLAAIERRKIHVVTVNDYLVQRDRDWTFPFFRALGLTVGAIHPQHMQDEDQKRLMYMCDVVYGTTSEFGFDYLRDNMKRRVEDQVQRRRDFAIVDEVDCILIDEARTPLIISGPAHEDQPRYDLADRLAKHLVDKQKPWQEMDDQVRRAKERVKGLEGDIRQVRDRSRVPQLQAELKQAQAELLRLEAERAKRTQYYEVHLERKAVHLTHEGIAEAQRAAGLGSLYVGENTDLPHLLEQALRAHVVYQRDRDYVIMNVPDPVTGRVEPSIVIVDVFTGRPMIGRQWSDGLHQAIEAKEHVPIKQETQTVATITIQNFFKMYRRLAGMTGTADTEAQEFHDIYGLDVVAIPTNKPMIRRDYDDLMFLREKDKWEAIVDEIKRFHDVGRPVLVGTTSVEKSERLSRMLTSKYGIRHEVLNAKQHEREAHIIENAGQLGAVMIATNMAGRGTDIKLGTCTREALLDHWLRRGIAPRTVTVDMTDAQLREAVYRKIAPKELGLQKRDIETMPFDELEMALLRHWAQQYTYLGPKVQRLDAERLREALDATGRFLLHRLRWFATIEELGGLHVIGTERHEARRIDNQLRGRSGRQGDRGSSRFFVSLEDDLMKMFAGETQMKILSRLGMKEGDSIEHPMLTRSVERAQRKVEERNFHYRKNLLEYDEVMEHQRQTFYGLRQRVLEGRGTRDVILEYIDQAITDACTEYLDPDYPLACIAEFVRQRLECSIAPESLRDLEPHEIERKIRDEAITEARHMIDVTLGEYIPDENSGITIDFDVPGLIAWARSRFGVELTPAELERAGAAGSRQQVQRLLVEAAERRIEQTDLSEIRRFLIPGDHSDTRADSLAASLRDRYRVSAWGIQELIAWAQRKFGIEVSAEEIVRAIDDPASPPQALLMARARQKYRQREIEYPVDFMLELTMLLMRQNPMAAARHLVEWANRRFGLNWTEDKLRTSTPAQVRQELLAASEQWIDSGRIEDEVRAAQACADDTSLEQHLRQRLNVGLPLWMRNIHDPAERADAIRGRVESVLRAEMVQLEQAILLHHLDAAWKDHLYAMDQVRDVINFRGYAQQDPRIEYKREGARLFREMMAGIRERVTDDIFRVRLSPAMLPSPGSAAPAAPPPPARAPARAPAMASSTISLPNLGFAPARPDREERSPS